MNLQIKLNHFVKYVDIANTVQIQTQCFFKLGIHSKHIIITHNHALPLMKINRHRCNQLTTPIKMKQLVDYFAQLHPRRVALSFMLAD